jgi:hypothetical protein
MSVILFNGLHAIDNYSSNETLNVLAFSGLKFRDKPEGNVLQTIPYGSKVVTLEPKNYDYLKTVEGIKGSWVKVRFNGNVGYVFDGFLSSLPAPSLSDDLKSYVKREFKLLSKEMPLAFLRDNDLGPSGSNVLFFEWKNQQGAYSEHFYYEGGGEYLSIPGLSMEEGYLLMRIIKRENIEHAKTELAKFEGFDARPYEQFVLNGISYYNAGNGAVREIEDYYEFDLDEGCNYILTITKHEGFLLIDLGGGC